MNFYTSLQQIILCCSIIVVYCAIVICNDYEDLMQIQCWMIRSWISACMWNTTSTVFSLWSVVVKSQASLWMVVSNIQDIMQWTRAILTPTGWILVSIQLIELRGVHCLINMCIMFPAGFIIAISFIVNCESEQKVKCNPPRRWPLTSFTTTPPKLHHKYLLSDCLRSHIMNVSQCC